MMISAKPFQRRLNSTSTAPHREDSQPNEGINKRKNPGPPAVMPAAPPVVRGRPWIRGQFQPRGGSARGSFGGRGRGYHEFPRGQGSRPVAQYTSVNTAARGESSGYSTGTRGSGSAKHSQPPRKETRGVYEGKRGSGFRHSSGGSGTPSVHDRDPAIRKNDRFSLHSGSTRYDSIPNGSKTPVSNSNKPMPIPIPVSVPIAQPKLMEAGFSDSMHGTPNPSIDIPLPPHKRRRLSFPPPSNLRVNIKSEDVEMLDPTCPSAAPPVPSQVSITPPQVSIKPEPRTPSPELAPTRRLVSQACAFYPLPPNCRKIDPRGSPNTDYAQHRTTFVAKERAVLRKKGFRATNVLFRDDGMVIEWTSPVPVWSDTLLPESEPEPPRRKRKVMSSLPLPTPRKKRKEPYSSSEAPSGSTLSPPAKRPVNLPVPVQGRQPHVVEPEEGSTPRKKDKGKAKEGVLPSPEPFPLPTSAPAPAPFPLPSSVSAPSPEPFPLPTSAPAPAPTPFPLPLSVSAPAPTLTSCPRRLHPLPVPKPRTSVPFVRPIVDSRGASPDSDIVEIERDVYMDKERGIGREREEDVDVGRERERGGDVDVDVDVDVGMDTDTEVMVSQMWSPDEMEGFEELALGYLDRYIKAFDLGPTALRPAYASNAVFSCRVPPSSSESSHPLFSSSSSSTRTRTHTTTTTRPALTRALAQLSSSYNFLPTGPTQDWDVRVHYDVAPLCEEAGGGLLLTVYGEIMGVGVDAGKGGVKDRTRAGIGEVLRLDQVFVLQKRAARKQSWKGEEEAWPLIAVSHQMNIRRRVGDSDGGGVACAEEFSWLR